MFKKALTAFILPFVVLLSLSDAGFANPAAQRWTSNVQRPAPNSAQSQNGATGVLQKMIVESGTATMKLDFKRLNGITSMAPKFEAWRFDVAANSFFSILVFNNLLRGPEQGSMALVPAGVNAPGYSNLPATLNASLKQLAIEKLRSSEQFDLAVRDAKTGFTFFNIEGQQYDYDAKGQLLNIRGGRLLISKEFADALGRPSDAGSVVGKISIGATMRPIEITQLVNGEVKSVIMSPLNGAAGSETPALAPGPDVIVGDLPEMAQYGSTGNFVGLGIGTTSCNNGDQPLHWFALPNTDHPVIPQNFYRMSGGTSNTDRFEQIGPSWLKHAFFALEGDACSFGCNTSGCSTGSNLCPGCSDPYGSSLNEDQEGIGSRAWVNPFTGVFPSGANNHTGHSHTGTSHRVTVATSDLDPSQNPGATYFAEGQYVTPHEYAWCQSNPGQCNMYDNVSHRQFAVSGGPTNFTFSGVAPQSESSLPSWLGQVAARR